MADKKRGANADAWDRHTVHMAQYERGAVDEQIRGVQTSGTFPALTTPRRKPAPKPKGK